MKSNKEDDRATRPLCFNTASAHIMTQCHAHDIAQAVALLIINKLYYMTTIPSFIYSSYIDAPQP